MVIFNLKNTLDFSTAAGINQIYMEIAMVSAIFSSENFEFANSNNEWGAAPTSSTLGFSEGK